jgi:uridine kinase
MNINTPMIKSALQYTQNGAPTAMPMYDFEKGVRQDPRWLSTDNAQDAFMSNAHQVLVNFGFEY